MRYLLVVVNGLDLFVVANCVLIVVCCLLFVDVCRCRLSFVDVGCVLSSVVVCCLLLCVK